MGIFCVDVIYVWPLSVHIIVKCANAMLIMCICSLCSLNSHNFHRVEETVLSWLQMTDFLSSQQLFEVNISKFFANRTKPCRYKTTQEYELLVSIYENLLKYASLWSHPSLGDLNEAPNSSSPGFFLQNLNSIFWSINQCVDHKLLLQLLLIVSVYFAVKLEKGKYRDFI